VPNIPYMHNISPQPPTIVFNPQLLTPLRVSLAAIAYLTPIGGFFVPNIPYICPFAYFFTPHELNNHEIQLFFLLIKSSCDRFF